MIDHISLPVTNYEKSKKFYLAALKPLDFEMGPEFDEACGMGPGNAEFWLVKKEKIGEPIHIAFQVTDKDIVNDFHKSALAAGAKDNGRPGLRENYSPNYYAAFVLDPDGHNIEVVCYR